MRIRLLYILMVGCLFCNKNAYCIEWNGAKPIIDEMLAYYEMHPNYSMIIYDEWIKSDGSTEAVGDTIFAHKYNDYGYIKNGPRVQVFTEQFDIYINEKDSTMRVREVSEEELAEIASLIPTMPTILKYFELCDSARIVSSSSNLSTIDFYFNHPLVNKSRLLIDGTGRVKEIYRYYTNPEEYISQHTVFVSIQSLNTSSIEEFREDSYLQISNTNNEVNIQASERYGNYNFQLIKF
jgi:hypothetical protein